MSEYVTAWADDLPGMTHGEEIVRCRDCKHSDTLESAPSVVIRCCYKNRDKFGVPRVVGDDGFCAWACRREQ